MSLRELPRQVARLARGLYRKWSTKLNRPDRRTRLNIEALEDRCVPALPTSVMPALETMQQMRLVGDFNGDSKADLAVMNASGQWSVRLSDGHAYQNASIWASWGSNKGWQRIITADFNDDGKCDLAGLTQTGQWIVSISTGTGFTTSARFSDQNRYASLLLGDTNGDGKTDIIGLTTTGNSVVLTWNGSSLSSSVWATGQYGAWTRLVIGDFNGDGKDDMAGLLYGRWLVGISNGTSFKMEAWGTATGTLNINTISVGDFNGDGKADLVWLTQQGNLFVDQSTGSKFVATQRGSGWTQVSCLLVADFDGNGSDDVAVIRSHNMFVEYFSSHGTIRQQLVGWAPGPVATASRVGDFDGDSKPDVIYMSPDGSYYYFQPGITNVPVSELAYVPYVGEIPPYLPNSPWSKNYSRTMVNATPLSIQRQMDFNNQAFFNLYVYHFRSELRRWQSQAAILGLIGNTTAFHQFLATKLDAKFTETRDLLASVYPGLTDDQYRVLMTLNLASGDFTYGALPAIPSLSQLIVTPIGNCYHDANLVRALLLIQGIPAVQYHLAYDFPVSWGRFVSMHNLVFADGLLLDGEVNLALNIGSLNQLLSMAPYSRLTTLLSAGDVYGFYDWLNYPPVRAEQLSRGFDGGILSWVYRYMLAGIDQGNTVVTKVSFLPQ